MMAWRIHLFPCRTQKLSFNTPKVVGGSLPARIGRCHASWPCLVARSFFIPFVRHLSWWEICVSAVLYGIGIEQNHNRLLAVFQEISTAIEIRRGLQCSGFPDTGGLFALPKSLLQVTRRKRMRLLLPHVKLLWLWPVGEGNGTCTCQSGAVKLLNEPRLNRMTAF